jgi:hypothetical protein
LTAPRLQVSRDGEQAFHLSTAKEQVRCRCQESRLGQPPCLVAEILRHAGNVMQHHDAGPWRTLLGSRNE